MWDNDYSFECGEDNDFEIIDGRYTCKSAFNFGSGSQSTDIRPIPVLEMFVDPATWPSSEFDNCYEFAPADGTSPPTTNTTDGNEAGPGEESPCLETGFGDCDQPGTTAPSSSATPSPTPAFTGSDDTTYKATYSARFKHILNEGCEGPSPDVVPFCVNGDIQLLATSDPTIRCSDPVQLNGTTTGALCSNTCSGTECESVFVDVDGTSFSVYGEITFECEGSMVDAARGGVVILGSDTGTCDGSANDMDNFGLNIMIGQLGVFCTDQYVFDDRYAECGLGSIPSDLDLGSYQCLSGRRCTDSCTVSINDIEISADHFRFPECIESSDGSAIPEINIPTIEPLLVGSYTAIFSSNYLVSTSELGGCTISVQGQRISCLDGEIRGPLVDPNFVICEKASNSIIECTGADDAMPINALENIIYVSRLCICLKKCHCFSL
mgnify:CR=1 FL=1